MTELTSEQRELADAYQVATEYDDWRGNRVTVPASTVLAVLAALGVDATRAESAAAALETHRGQERARLVPPTVVARFGERSQIPVNLADDDELTVRIELEEGMTRPGTVVEGRLRSSEQQATAAAYAIEIPEDLPLGYHRLVVNRPSGDVESTVIVTPAFLGFPDQLGDNRAWGFATQLYSVRSRASWGVGDAADLRSLAQWSAELGADYLLVNPMSAAEPVGPMEPSPYLPTSRRFVNPLYLRIEEIPEYVALSPADRAAIATLRDEVHAKLDDADVIDRDTAWSAKGAALHVLHETSRTPDRESAYRAFVESEGRPLRDFATWCAIAEDYGADWHEWPEGLRSPSHANAADFRHRQPVAVDFYLWLQWLLDDQLRSAQEAALETGMRLGVMHDLAVGVHPRGADSWTLQDTLAQGINVGAPPDAFNQIGQNWSQPPWRPDRLAASGYRPYRHLIARLLRHAGALRIDHIIGLFRLWWIPEGEGPDNGTYVRYDHEAMIGILALEAHRASAVVVGEDLGNVEASARAYLAHRGIFGTSILWFERDDGGRPLPAPRWREYSLASVTTHDLPPTAGYLAGDHVRLRDRLGLLTRSSAEESAADEADRHAWVAVLQADGLIGDDATAEEIVVGLHRYLTRTPARLLCVALTDAVGDRRTQNQPGTTDEYPNWRVPLSGPDGRVMSVEDVISSRRARKLAAVVDQALRSP